MATANPEKLTLSVFHEDASKPKGCGQEGAFVSLFIKTVNLLSIFSALDLRW